MQVLLVCLIAGAAAFAPQPASLRSSPRLAGYSEALAEAETASSKFGKESSEAKIAWSVVAEIESAQSRGQISKKGLDEECDPNAPSQECIDYASQLAELQVLMAQYKPIAEKIKFKIAPLAGQGLAALAGAAVPESAAAKAATGLAEAAAKKFGASSVEAKAAWEVVAEINDAADASLASQPALDESCVADAMEKCVAFEAAMASLEAAMAAAK